jgi:hypothetical protein
LVAVATAIPAQIAGIPGDGFPYGGGQDPRGATKPVLQLQYMLVCGVHVDRLTMKSRDFQ